MVGSNEEALQEGLVWFQMQEKGTIRDQDLVHPEFPQGSDWE